MDIATIIGIILGFSVILLAIVSGGGWKMFLNIPSLGITIGGMLCATLIHFSLHQFISIFSIVKKTIVTKIPTPAQLTQRMVDFAAINRRDGALALEKEIENLDNPFFLKSVQMLVDGQEADEIRDTLELEIENLRNRHEIGKKILEYMGSAAPAFGMIGTLIGLIQMLRNLSDPNQIGVGMATALLTTFYGAFSANLVFLPLAGKLEIYSKAEATSMEMIVEGICSIAQGQNPTAVREKLHCFVSHSKREEVKATV